MTPIRHPGAREMGRRVWGKGIRRSPVCTSQELHNDGSVLT